MTDIRNPRLLYAKGFLFLATGLVAGGLLLVLAPSWRVALLLGVCVWSLCRFYYFAFYVIEHYVDPEYRFSGLSDFARYAVQKRFGRRK